MPVATHCYLRELESREKNKSDTKIYLFVCLFVYMKDTLRLGPGPGLSGGVCVSQEGRQGTVGALGVHCVASGIWQQ